MSINLSLQIVVLLLIASCLSACGGSDSAPATPTANNWDQMNWDQGKWQ